jgi:hypothetical protein
MSKTGRWLADTAERVLSTAAETTLAALPTSYLPNVSIPWWAAFAAGGFAGVVALLKCIAALKVGAPDSASLLPAETDPPQEDGWGLIEVLAVVAVVLITLLLLGYLR